MQDLPICPDLVPSSPFQLGLERLLHAAFRSVDLNPLANQIVAYLEQHPEDAVRYMDLSFILQIYGNEALAATIQQEALNLSRHFRLPTAVGATEIRLLAIMVPGNFMANTPLEFLVSGAGIALETLYLMPGEAIPQNLPEHDVLFMAIGESAAARELLVSLCDAVVAWKKPLLNSPFHILRLARDTASTILNDVDNICMPLTAHVSGRDLAHIAAGKPVRDFIADAEWPLIVRPLDSHAGKGLEKVDDARELSEYIDLYGTIQDFYLSSFVNYRNDDGLFRKYRIVLIEGQPFLCHMAISMHWMIHYLNADMTENASRRFEEEQAMGNFDTGFALRHAKAFAHLNDLFPLDYYGIDCGETSDGRLLIFEVDTGMIVHAMDPVELFPYKQVAMRKVFDAFQNLVKKAAGWSNG